MDKMEFSAALRTYAEECKTAEDDGEAFSYMALSLAARMERGSGQEQPSKKANPQQLQSLNIRIIGQGDAPVIMPEPKKPSDGAQH